jgi:hypothetical protein
LRTCQKHMLESRLLACGRPLRRAVQAEIPKVNSLRLHRVHPETGVDVIIDSRFVDLAAREADIAERGGRSPSPTLLEQPLGEVHASLHASADYLARRLPVRFLAAGDYASQEFVAEEQAPRGRDPAQWLTERGASRFSFRSNSFEARVKAAQEGMGLMVLAVGTEASYPTLLRVGLEQPLPSIREVAMLAFGPRTAA